MNSWRKYWTCWRQIFQYQTEAGRVQQLPVHQTYKVDKEKNLCLMT